MKLTVTIRLENLPEDTDPDEVVRVLRNCAAEWLDFDQHPEDLHLSVEKTPCLPTV